MSARSPLISLLVAVGVLASSSLCHAWLEPRVVGSLGDRAIQRVAVQGDYAYCATSGGMLVLDVSDPTNPMPVASYVCMGMPTDVAISGDYAYLAADALRVVDISDPSHPAEVGADTAYDGSTAIALSGNYAYVTRVGDGLLINDISNPHDPQGIGGVAPTDIGRVHGVAVSGDYAYVAGPSNGLTVVDISDPAAASVVGNLPAGPAASVAVSGRYVFGGSYAGELVVVDVLDPGAPVQVGSCATPDSVLQVALSGGHAYLATEAGGLRVLDISDPTNPTEVGSWDPLASVRGVTVVGDRAYVAAGGLHVLDISDPTDPVEMGSCDTGEAAWQVALSGGHAYLSTMEGPLRAVDVSNPAVPVQAGTWEMPAAICANEIAISGSYAYVSGAGAGLRIIDISDPQAPVEAGAWTDGCIRSLAVSGSYAYTYDGPNLRVIDISDPQAAIEAGACAIGAENIHKIVISGSYAYVASFEAGIRVIDIGDPTDPTPVASVPGSAGGVAISGGYAYFANRDAGLEVIDISDPTTPTVVGTCLSLPAAWNSEIAIAGDRAYVSTRKLLLVVDISDPTAPVEVGQYHAVGGIDDVAASGDCVYLADSYEGLVILEFLHAQYGPTPVAIEGKMLVSGAEAGGNIAYSIEGSSDNIAPAAVCGSLSPPGDQALHEEWLGEWPEMSIELWKADIDGSNPVNLTAAAGFGGINCCADWSPDGSMIAFQNCDWEPYNHPGYNWPCEKGFHVWIMNADGSGAHRLLPEGSPPTSDPSWAPDGSRILCQMGEAAATHRAYFTIATDGTDFEALGGAHSEPDWSPDGSKIASCSNEWDGDDGYWQGLQLCDADGRNPQVLFERHYSESMMKQHLIDHGEDPAEAGGALWAIGPVSCQWSPSGDRIAFTGAPHFDPAGPVYHEQLEVWVYELATGTLTKITSMAVYLWDVSWIGPNTSPEDPQATVCNTTVTFSEVTDDGFTNVIHDDAPPSLPPGYQFLGEFYEITTTATYTGPITVCMTYTDEEFPPGPEEAYLSILHWVEDGYYWEDITTSRDPDTNTICGEVDSLSLFTLSAARLLFKDVPYSGYGPGGADPHWAYSEIKACVEAGIVGGYPDGSYQPDWDVTRAQMAVFIARAIATPTGEEGVQAWEAPETPTFPDVADYSWCYKHVELLYDKGIVEGYPDGFYRPTTWVSRDQMAVYMARAVADPLGEEGLAGYTPPEDASFLDADAEHWAYKHIEYCAENSIVAGYPDGFYRPSKLVTRDQMAVYVARAFGLI